MEGLAEIVEEVKRKVLFMKALEAARDLAQLLSALDGESENLCQAILIMHRLEPDVPMPEDMYALLGRFGHKPDVKVLSEAEMIAFAEGTTCECEKCQELRAKGQARRALVSNAPGAGDVVRQHIEGAAKPDVAHLVTPGPNTVH